MVWRNSEIVTLRILHFQRHVQVLKNTSKKLTGEFCNECKHFATNISNLGEQERQNAHQYLTNKYDIIVLGNTLRTQIQEVGKALEKIKNLMVRSLVSS